MTQHMHSHAHTTPLRMPWDRRSRRRRRKKGHGHQQCPPSCVAGTFSSDACMQAMSKPRSLYTQPTHTHTHTHTQALDDDDGGKTRPSPPAPPPPPPPPPPALPGSPCAANHPLRHVRGRTGRGDQAGLGRAGGGVYNHPGQALLSPVPAACGTLCAGYVRVFLCGWVGGWVMLGWVGLGGGAGG